MDEPQFDAINHPIPDNGGDVTKHGKIDHTDHQEMEKDETKASRRSRPFLGIHFQCCRTYGRIYQNDAQTEYCGRCPRCHCQVRVPIGPGGSSSRFFNAG